MFLSLLLNDINGIVTVLADNSNMLANLTYSRELETEADMKGMAALASNGISLKGFVDLFTLLRGEHGDVSGLKLLSTHPMTEERLRVAEEMVKGQEGVESNAELEVKWRALQDMANK